MGSEMNNHDKLMAAGLIDAGAHLSASERDALAAMSEAEIAALVSAKVNVEPGEEKPIGPTYHVTF
jgi:hypothetical protein